jgi:hypothetical protein
LSNVVLKTLLTVCGEYIGSRTLSLEENVGLISLLRDIAVRWFLTETPLPLVRLGKDLFSFFKLK